DEFVRLCALSTSGELSMSERQALDAHLSECRECRETMEQFDSIIDDAMPIIGAACVQDEDEGVDGPRFQREALQDLLSGLPGQRDALEEQPHESFKQNSFTPSFVTSRTLWAICAAAIMLFAALGIFLYRIGVVHGTQNVVSQELKP